MTDSKVADFLFWNWKIEEESQVLDWIKVWKTKGPAGKLVFDLIMEDAWRFKFVAMKNKYRLVLSEVAFICFSKLILLALWILLHV